MKKKIIVSLFAAMALSLVACGKDEQPANITVDAVELNLEEGEAVDAEAEADVEEDVDADVDAQVDDGMKGEIGTFDANYALQIFADNTDVWYSNDERAEYSYSVCDLMLTGTPVIIRSTVEGSGNYTYSTFYVVDSNENVVELGFSEDDVFSQPDIYDNNCQILCDSATGAAYIISEDMLVGEGDTVITTLTQLELTIDGVVLTPIYSKVESGVDVTYLDGAGNEVTADDVQAIEDELRSGKAVYDCYPAWIYGANFAESTPEDILLSLTESYPMSIVYLEDAEEE